MSEEARRYVPHFVGPFALTMDLGERKIPSSASDFWKTLVEPLSDTRTTLTDFFSILLERKDRSMLDDVKNRVKAVEQMVSELRGHL